MDLTMLQNMLPIVVVCALVFFLLFLRSKSNLLIRLILRTVIGFFSILTGNAICAYFSLGLFVGVNPATLLVCAILGLPGVVGMFLLGML